MIVWYKGYSRGNLRARILYRMCPTSYTPILLKADLSNLTTCHHYVCENTMCKVFLNNYEGPIGPSEIMVSAAEAAENLSTTIKVAPRCTSKIYFRAISSKQWIINRDIYIEKINYTSSQSIVWKKLFDFLYNATAMIFSCSESPSALSIRLEYCKPNLPIESTRIILSPPCYTLITLQINDTITIYSYKSIAVKIEMRFDTNISTSCTCSNYTVTMHELSPEDDTVYMYTAHLLNKLSWETHKSQHGFRLRFHRSRSCINMIKACPFYINLKEAATPLRRHSLVYHSKE